MKRYIFGCLVLVLLGMIVVGCGGTTTETDEQAIQRVLSTYAKCMVDGDVDGVLNLHAYTYRYEENGVKEDFDYNKLKSNTEGLFEREDVTFEKLTMIKCKKNGFESNVDIHFYKEFQDRASGINYKSNSDRFLILNKNYKIIYQKTSNRVNEEIKP